MLRLAAEKTTKWTVPLWREPGRKEGPREAQEINNLKDEKDPYNVPTKLEPKKFLHHRGPLPLRELQGSWACLPPV